MKNKVTILILLVLPLMTNANDIDTALGNASSKIRGDDIPAGDAGYSYVQGAAIAKDSIPAPTYSKTFEVGANIYMSRYRACGEMNPFDNVQARLTSQIEEKVDELQAVFQSIPQLIMDSAVEYAMAKINPTLNQLFTKKMDEYIELFRMHVKTCEDVQRDLSNNPNASVFDDLFKIAIADQWEISINDGTFDNSNKFKEKLIKQAKKEGLLMADGKRYGGTDSDGPINFLESLATSGINLITGRNTTSQWENSFSPTQQKEKPITSVFKKPEELVEFLEEIYGNTTYQLSASGSATGVKSKAGIGYYRYYTEKRLEIYDALTKYVNQEMTRTSFETTTGILIPPAIVDDVRMSDTYARQMEVERLSKQYAIDYIKRKLMLARSALDAGANAPNMKQSQLAGISDKEYKKLYFRIQDDLAELDSLRY